MTQNWLEKLLDPRSVAIVGASDDIKAPGGRVLRFMLSYGYTGKIWPVNPKRSEVQGVQAYAAVKDLPGRPDLVVLLVPAAAALEAMEQCGPLRVPVVVVGSAGFSEAGPEGERMQARLAEIATQNGIRLIGPNTNGIINTRNGLTATFTPALDQEGFKIVDGPVAIVSQSGAIGGALFYDAQRSGIPVGRLLNTGNEIDISLAMAIGALVEPEMNTDIILAYSEGLRRPQDFISAARRARELDKRIVLLKTGTSQAGAKAAAAHTASLAGEDRVYDGVMRQLGVIRAKGMAQLLDIGRVLSAYRKPIGRRASIVSLSGGVGIMLTDALSENGMGLAPFSDEERRKLDPLLPPFFGRNNPLDVGGSAFHDLNKMRSILQIYDANENSDFSVVATGSFERRQLEIADVLIDEAKRLKKPLFVVWFGGGDGAQARLNAAGIPAFPDARRLIDAVAPVVNVLARPQAAVSRAAMGQDAAAKVKEAIAAARKAGRKVMDEVDGKKILAAYGVNVAREAVVQSVDECAAALAQLRLPVVAKLRSDELVHKARVGGVRLGLKSAEAAGAAVSDLLALARTLGLGKADIVLQEEVPAGTELLLGMKRDPTFGPVVMLGVGGVHTEAWEDVQIRLPDCEDDVADMLASLRHRKLIEGSGEKPGVAAAMIAPTVAAFARLVRDHGHEFEAIDVNPVIVDTASGSAVVVDTVLFLADSPGA